VWPWSSQPTLLQASQLPLVGIWVAGVSSITHSLVTMAALFFYVSTRYADKVLTPDGSFLVLAFFSGSPGYPQVFECNAASRRGVPLMPHRVLLELLPEAPVATSRATPSDGRDLGPGTFSVLLEPQPHLLYNLYVSRAQQASSGAAHVAMPRHVVSRNTTKSLSTHPPPEQIPAVAVTRSSAFADGVTTAMPPQARSPSRRQSFASPGGRVAARASGVVATSGAAAESAAVAHLSTAPSSGSSSSMCRGAARARACVQAWQHGAHACQCICLNPMDCENVHHPSAGPLHALPPIYTAPHKLQFLLEKRVACTL
jgi:hypothetical protein